MTKKLKIKLCDSSRPSWKHVLTTNQAKNRFEERASNYLSIPANSISPEFEGFWKKYSEGVISLFLFSLISCGNTDRKLVEIGIDLIEQSTIDDKRYSHKRMFS